MGLQGERKRILILVKTYPSISKSYGELVCTAGIDENGHWIRLYPMPIAMFRDNEIKKYTWIEVEVTKRDRRFDDRPESYVPQRKTLQLIRHLPTNRYSDERRRAVLGKVKTFTNLSELIELGLNKTISLALFKPKRVLKISVARDTPEYSDEDWERFRAYQSDLFENPDFFDKQEPIKKLPFKLQISFEDVVGRPSQMTVLDWEVGALWYNHLRDKPFEVIKEEIEKKYSSKPKEDLYLYLGTMYRNVQKKAENPWSIIGLAWFEEQIQSELPLDI